MWSIPQGPLNQLGDEEEESKRGMLRILSECCGGGHPAPPLQELHFLGSPIQLEKFALHTVLVNPEWGDWTPWPLNQTAVDTSAAVLDVNGMQFPCSNGHGWVNVGHIQAGLAGISDRAVLMWYQRNATARLPEVRGTRSARFSRRTPTPTLCRCDAQILRAFGRGHITPQPLGSSSSYVKLRARAGRPSALHSLEFLCAWGVCPGACPHRSGSAPHDQDWVRSNAGRMVSASFCGPFASLLPALRRRCGP
jgi:hypothetical protein